MLQKKWNYLKNFFNLVSESKDNRFLVVMFLSTLLKFLISSDSLLNLCCEYVCVYVYFK